MALIFAATFSLVGAVAALVLMGADLPAWAYLSHSALAVILTAIFYVNVLPILGRDRPTIVLVIAGIAARAVLVAPQRPRRRLAALSIFAGTFAVCAYLGLIALSPTH